MTATLYPKAASRFARGEIDWEDDTLVVAWIDEGFEYSSDHEYAVVLVGDILDSTTLTGCTVLEDGVVDADDITSLVINVGFTGGAVVIYKDTGSSATSPLIYFSDENEDTTPINREGDGSAAPILWSNGADRIFRL